MISKVAYNYGMVITTCKTCRNRHLIADNEGKLDFKEYGKKIEEYLVQKGENVQRLSISAGDLSDYYILDQDGKVSLVPKSMGQPSLESTIVEIPTPEAGAPKFKGFAPGSFKNDADGIPTLDLGGGRGGGTEGEGGKGGESSGRPTRALGPG